MLSIVLAEEDVWDPEIWMKHLAQSGNRPPVLLMLFERVKDSWDFVVVVLILVSGLVVEVEVEVEV